jgi:D-beta-D-heptose 7-phosphate kinase/D-beta-D-heptose 1-phosphate adenosyltransferase
VAINSDRGVRALKGPDRPVIGQSDRAALLAALSCVDGVLIFDEPTPLTLLERIRPDVLVKGGTYTADEVVGRELVEGYGGRIAVTNKVEGVSTSNILASLRRGSSSAEGPS